MKAVSSPVQRVLMLLGRVAFSSKINILCWFHRVIFNTSTVPTMASYIVMLIMPIEMYNHAIPILDPTLCHVIG